MNKVRRVIAILLIAGILTGYVPAEAFAKEPNVTEEVPSVSEEVPPASEEETPPASEEETPPASEEEMPPAQEEEALPAPDAEVPVATFKSEEEVYDYLQSTEATQEWNSMEVIKHPEMVDAELGDSVTFEGAAKGINEDGITYQWQKNVTGAPSMVPTSTEGSVEARVLEKLDIAWEGAAVTEEEVKAAQAAAQSEPITVDKEGWEDIPGANNADLTLTVDKEMATKAVNLRLVAKSGNAEVATAEASVRASTQFGGGDGTAYNPYRIYTYDQFNNIRNFLEDPNVHFQLCKDIEGTGRGWVPIGTGGGIVNPQFGRLLIPEGRARVFRGTLDGNGYVLKNFSFNSLTYVEGMQGGHRTSLPAVAFFGATDGAIIKNLAIENVKVVLPSDAGQLPYSNRTNSPAGDRDYIAFGGVVSSGFNTTVQNCTFRGEISGGFTSEAGIYTYGGVMIGWSYPRNAAGSGKEWLVEIRGSGKIENCFNTVDINFWPSGKKGSNSFISPIAQSRYEDSIKVINSGFDYTKAYGGAGVEYKGTACKDGTVLKSLNDYVSGRPGWNSWQPDSSLYPILSHLPPLDFTVSDYIYNYDGNPKGATVVPSKPDVKQGEDWDYHYEQDGERVDKPTEVGYYNLVIDIPTEPAPKYFKGKVTSTPSDAVANAMNEGSLIIKPKADGAAPDISDVKYMNTEGKQGPYTSPEWTDSQVKVTFNVKEEAKLPTKQVTIGSETILVDADGREVSGIDSVQVVFGGQTYTAKDEGNGTYSFTTTVKEGEYISSGGTIIATDKQGNKKETDVNILNVDKSGPPNFTVTASPDGSDKKNTLDNESECYQQFAKKTIDFDVKMVLKNPEGEIKEPRTKFVPNGVDPDTIPWEVHPVEGAKSSLIIPLTKEGDYDGYLYVSGKNRSNVERVDKYRFMIEDSKPAKPVVSFDAWKGPDDGTGEAGMTPQQQVAYEEGEWYQKLVLHIDYAELGIPQSGIDKIILLNEETKEQINAIDLPDDVLNLGVMQGTKDVEVTTPGQYRIQVQVVDKAGNKSTYTTEEVRIDSAAPMVKAVWKTPAGTNDKLMQALPYAFGNWSDKKATVELSLENDTNVIDPKATTTVSGIAYYYRTTKVGEYAHNDHAKDAWTRINEEAVSPEETVVFRPETEGDYIYQFKAVNEAWGSTRSDKLVKVDTLMPDKPDFAIVDPNQQGWYTSEQLNNGSVELTLSLPLNEDASVVTLYYEVYYREDTKSGAETDQKTGEGVLNQKNNNPVKMNLAKEGVHTVKTWTVDEAGNRYDETRTYKVDTTSPVIAGVFHGDESVPANKLGPWQAPDHFQFFRNQDEELIINASDITGKIERIEYLLCKDTAKNDIEAPEIKNGKWLVYNKDAKPVLSKEDFRGSIFVRVYDEAGNMSTYQTDNIVVEHTKPKVTVTPKQDISKWQQKVEFDVVLEDVTAGLTRIVLTEDAHLSAEGRKSEIQIPEWDLEAVKAGGLYPNSIKNFTAEKDPVTGLYTGSISFTYVATRPAYTRDKLNQYDISLEDKAGNANAITPVTFKIDTQAPEVVYTLSSPRDDVANQGKWYTLPVTVTLNNEKEDKTEEPNNISLTRSKVTWYYKMDKDNDWTKMNDTPVYGEYTFVLKDDMDENITFKAVSESGVESAVTAPQPIRIDKVNPDQPEVTITPPDPDGSNGWYKNYPAIQVKEPVQLQKTAPQTTYYKLYTGDGRGVLPSTLGQTILNSFRTGTQEEPVNQDQNDKKDKIADSGAPISVAAAGGTGAETYTPPAKRDVFVDNKDIKILNIVPVWNSTSGNTGGGVNGDRLRSWLQYAGMKLVSGPLFGDSESGGGNTVFTKQDANGDTIKITVYAISYDQFNKNPDKYLKDANQKYVYDVVAPGMADSNGNAGFADTTLVRSALRNYMNAGYGFYIGHDSIWCEGQVEQNAKVMNDIFAPLADIEKGNGRVGNWNLASGVDTYVKIKETGLITNYPYKIGDIGDKISTAVSHTNYQVANGNIWVSFDKDNVKETPDPTFNGRDMFYLTTSGNVGMSQIGHSACVGANPGGVPLNMGATKTETQLLANTLIYLAQKPTSQFVTDNGKPIKVTAIIRTQEQLELIRQNDANYPKDGYYTLGENIDLSGSWQPIEGFSGSFDGNDYTITGGSLFADTKASTRVINVNVNGAQLVTGENKGDITNCKSTNATKSLVGENSGRISYCSVTGTTIGSTSSNAGGIASSNNGNIQHCTVEANVVSGGHTGGIVGVQGNGSIRNCTFKGAVSSSVGDSKNGGIVGTVKSGTKTVLMNCRVEQGSISGAYAGGIAGYADGSVTVSNNTVKDMNITATVDAGGLIAKAANGGSINNCVVESTIIAGTDNAGGIIGGIDTGFSVRNVSVTGGSVSIAAGGAVGGITGSNAGRLEYAFSNAAVTGSDGAAKVGGAVGENIGTIVSVYADGTVTGGAATATGGFVGVHSSPGQINGCGTTQSTFAGINYDSGSSGPVISADGIYTLEVWAEDESIDNTETDGVHNKSNVYKKVLKVDTTDPAPFEMLVDEKDFFNTLLSVLTFGLYDKTTKVEINAKDNLSGVDSIRYEVYETPNNAQIPIDPGDEQNSSGTGGTLKETKTVTGREKVSFSISPYFKGYVKAIATDVAGNIVPINTSGLLINSDLPKVVAEAKIGSDAYNGDWTNKDVTIGLSFDNSNHTGGGTLSGAFAGYEVSVNGGPWTTNGITNPTNKTGASYKVTQTSQDSYQFRAKITGRTDNNTYSLESNSTQVLIDKVVPVVNQPQFSVDPVKVNGANVVKDGYVVYGEFPAVSIDASDTPSGLKSEKYQLNTNGITEAEKNYTGAFTPSKDGRYELSYTALDRAGNSTTLNPTPVKFLIDTKKPPKPIVTGDANGQNYRWDEWVKEDVELTADYDQPEPISGSREIQYAVYENGVMQGTWQVYDGTTKPAITADGQYEVHFKTVSNAGHESEETVVSVKRKDTVPDLVVTMFGGTATIPGTTTWTNQDVTFDAATTTGDKLYMDGTKKLQKHDKLPVIKEGIKEYTFQSENEAGVKSAPQSYQVALDKTTPDNPKISDVLTQGDIKVGWVSKQVDVTVTDPTVERETDYSPRTLYYRVYASTQTKPEYIPVNIGGNVDKAEFTIDKDGIWMVEAYTQDLAGNKSDIVEKAYQVDLEDPLVKIDIEGSSIAGTTDPVVYGEEVKAVIIANDAGSGIDKIYYKLIPHGSSQEEVDGIPYITNNNIPIAIRDFHGVVVAKAVDKVGHESYETSTRICVDTKQPKVDAKGYKATDVAFTKAVKERTWYDENLAVKATYVNGSALSGADHYEYYDGNNWVTMPGGVLALTTNGQHEVKVRVVSKAGHSSEEVVRNLWIDRVLVPGDPGYPDNPDPDRDFLLVVNESYPKDKGPSGTWHNQINYVPTVKNPPLSGVTYYYKLESDSSWTKLSTDTLIVTEGTGEQGEKYLFKAVTAVGKDSNTVIKTAFIDAVEPLKPIVNLDVTSGTKGKNGWYTSSPNVKVVVAAPNEDIDNKDRSDVNAEYLLAQQGEKGTYEPAPAEFTLPGDGIYDVQGRAYDQAANQSTATPRTAIKLDSTAPEKPQIQVTYTNGGALAEFINMATFGLFGNKEIRVTIKASDALSGVQTIRYKEPGSKEWKEKTADAGGSITFDRPIGQDGKVTAEAIDYAGNVSVQKTSDNVLTEAERPNLEIETTKENKAGWITGKMDCTIKALDSDSGLDKVKVYIGQGAGTEGLTPVEEKDYSTKNAPEKAEQTIRLVNDGTVEGHEVTITAVATDLSGNEQRISKTVKYEKATPTVTAASQISTESGFVSYDGSMTANTIFTGLSFSEPISGVGSLEYQKKGEKTWYAINDFANRQHVFDEEVKEDYTFRLITKAGNQASTTEIPIWIERALPETPTVYVKDKQGVDVSGVWVNEAPDITVEIPGHSEKMVRDTSEYRYETIKEGATVPDMTNSISVTEKPKTESIQKITDEGVYMIQAWTQKKDGSLIGPGGTANGQALYDKTQPSDASLSYERREDRIYLRVQIEDALSGGAFIEYKLGENGTVIKGSTDTEQKGMVYIDITDLQPLTPILIVGLTDHAGNRKDLSNAPIEEIPDLDAIGGPVITLDMEHTAPVNGWFNDKSLQLRERVEVVGYPQDERKLGYIRNKTADGEWQKEIWFDEQPGTPEHTMMINVPEQGKELEVQVEACDVNGVKATKTYRLNHDSVEPEAPSVSLSCKEEAYTGAFIQGEDIQLTVVPPTEDEKASSLANWQYSLDGGTTWSEAIDIVQGEAKSLTHTFIKTEGVSTDQLVVRVNDLAGNLGIPSAPLSIHNQDTTPPRLVDLQYEPVGRTTLEQIGNFLTFGNFFKEGVRATFTIKDGETDPNKLYYTLPGETQQEIQVVDDKASFMIPMNTKGIIPFWFDDKAGNRVLVSNLRKDKDGNGSDKWLMEELVPTYSDSKEDDYGKKDIEGWSNQDVVVDDIIIKDEDAGLYEVVSQLGDEEPILTRDGILDTSQIKEYMLPSMTITKEGRNRLVVNAKDNATNEGERTYEVRIDKTKPQIGFHMKGITNQDGAYLKTADCTIRVNENLSGIKQFQFQVDDGEIMTVTNTDFAEKSVQQEQISHQLTTEGDHTVKVTVTDHAGNVAVEKQNITIQKTEKQEPSSGEQPKTGDRNLLWLWCLLACIGFGTIVIVIKKRR